MYISTSVIVSNLGTTTMSLLVIAVYLNKFTT